MKSSKSSKFYTPFEDLKALLKGKSYQLSENSADRESVSMDHELGPENDEQLFMQAMEGVKPVSRDSLSKKQHDVRLPENNDKDEDEQVKSHLENLVNRGEGFIVAYTPEYIEGTGYRVRKDVARRLHRGDFSIQAHTDLHGCNVEEAKQSFERFLKDSVMSGKRAVLIVHGRGRSSQGEPILKNKVVEWLTSGPWRKWVMAFTSARSCDGGTGATYVLLRERPLTKRYRKNKKVSNDHRGNTNM